MKWYDGLKSIRFLRKHGLDKLCEQFSVAANRHEYYPNLVQLKYNQIESPMGEREVQECRGLIVDEDDDFKPIAFPYTKFFNHGQGHAAHIHWGSAEVMEKLDGSIMTLYFYDGIWMVASSGLPDASGQVYGEGITFKKLFWRTWNELDYETPMTRGRELYCYMFELMTPQNRVVIPYKTPRIVLHGARNMSTGIEEDPVIVAMAWGWDCVKSYPLTTLDEVIASAEAFGAIEGEGYVVCDHKFRRIKVKNPAYVAVHNLRDGWGPRRILQLVRQGEGEEFLSYFPEFVEEYEEIKGQFDMLCEEAGDTYSRYRHLEDQKEFALSVKQKAYCGALFALRAGKVESIAEFYKNIGIKNLEKLLGIKVISRRIPPQNLKKSGFGVDWDRKH